jgi:hypothetical protein
MQIALSNIQALKAKSLEKFNQFFFPKAQRKVLIYSNQHRAYWRSNAQGYCLLKEEAGKYSFEDALQLTMHCGSEKQIIFHFINN